MSEQKGNKRDNILSIDLLPVEKNLEDGSSIIEFIPHPDRYELVETEKGVKNYKDKNTGITFNASVFEESNKQARQKIYLSPPKEDNCTYLKRCRKELLEKWDHDQRYDEQESLKKYLKKIRGKDIRIVILYVDLEESTEISSNVDIDINAKIIKIFLREMSKVIDNFRGYVLKFNGDCVIAIFFADENFTSMSNNAIQSAMIMISVIEYIINPIFIEKCFPKIGCHIGMDIGIVRVDTIEIIDIASFVELIGYPMNLTSKIQSYAGHNEILLGKNLYALLHFKWQDHCRVKDLGKEWTRKDSSGDIYKIYEFTREWKCENKSCI